MLSLKTFVELPDISETIVNGESYPSMFKFMKQWKDAIDNIDPQLGSVPVWFRPTVPSKKNGRKGTRKGWKRNNRPRWMHFRLRNGLDWMGRLYLYEGRKPRPPVHMTFTETISSDIASFLKAWSNNLSSNNQTVEVT